MVNLFWYHLLSRTLGVLISNLIRSVDSLVSKLVTNCRHVASYAHLCIRLSTDAFYHGISLVQRVVSVSPTIKMVAQQVQKKEPVMTDHEIAIIVATIEKIVKALETMRKELHEIVHLLPEIPEQTAVTLARVGLLALPGKQTFRSSPLCPQR